MTVLLDLRELLACIGGAVVVIIPLILALALYANFGVYRKGEGGKGDN